MSASPPLWSPNQASIESALMTGFLKKAQNVDPTIKTYQDLYAWSVRDIPAFWSLVWDFCDVVGEKGNTPFLSNPIFQRNKFFPEARLNYAENLLKRQDESDALVFWGEDKVRRRMSHKDLYNEVHRLAHALKTMGIKQGDRVAAYLPNLPETIVGLLACSSIGAVWSSCSPDFGVKGASDRFQQITPKVLFVVDHYYYNGKVIECREKVEGLVKALPSVEKVIVIGYEGGAPKQVPSGKLFIDYPTFTALLPSDPLRFEKFPFDHPLYVLFSSGTTGKPKCIVHRAGGVLLQHLKEHQLHCNIKPNDRVFYFTTCGWMMWNWLVTALASNATLLLYDGSPFATDTILFDYAEEEAMTLFGTSAKYIDTLHKKGLLIKENYPLKALRTLTSTGSPLAPESFHYVYEHIKEDVNLASISGGTDIVSCFALGNPITPVYEGELQTRGLGMAVEVFDEKGHALKGEKGELVCTAPFPSMPLQFWNDPEGVKFQHTYFDRFPNIWHHGDYVELTEHDGLIIYGRSDSTLNSGGVRIGTAEIYGPVEAIPEVEESVCIGQDWKNDTRIILFVKLLEGLKLTEALTQTIRSQIRKEATPRHVPAKVIQVPDIPKTISGKISEKAIQQVIHGHKIQNKTALVNPDALAYYKNIKELEI